MVYLLVYKYLLYNKVVTKLFYIRTNIKIYILLLIFPNEIKL